MMLKKTLLSLNMGKKPIFDIMEAIREIKDVRVAFFAEGADAEDVKAAGADVVGGLEIIEEILKSGKIDFDRCLATPKTMPRVCQGSVTKDVTKAVKDAKAGHTKFRMDKTSILHVPLGKIEEQIQQQQQTSMSKNIPNDIGLLPSSLAAPSTY
ncbi:unnamed protein product [Cochlearia groenlandica]